MADLMKSRHAFGAEEGIDSALAQGLIDAYDILFLNGGKIGWIDKDGNKVIAEGKDQVATVDQLPEVGDANKVYIYDSKFYFWNGSEFVSPASDGGVAEDVVDEKIQNATDVSKAYTDEQIANAISIIEF